MELSHRDLDAREVAVVVFARGPDHPGTHLAAAELEEMHPRLAICGEANVNANADADAGQLATGGLEGQHHVGGDVHAHRQALPGVPGNHDRPRVVADRRDADVLPAHVAVDHQHQPVGTMKRLVVEVDLQRRTPSPAS